MRRKAKQQGAKMSTAGLASANPAAPPPPAHDAFHCQLGDPRSRGLADPSEMAIASLIMSMFSLPRPQSIVWGPPRSAS